jgi:hypothetical protein
VNVYASVTGRVQHPFRQYPSVSGDYAGVGLFEQRLELAARFVGLDL